MKRIRASVGVMLFCLLVTYSTTLASPDIDIDATTLYVSPAGADSPSCGQSNAPCRTIQAAINRIPEGSTGEVRVAQGTYRETSNCVNSEAVACVLSKQVSLLGGYNGNWSSRDPARYPVVLDGEGRTRVIRVQRTTAPAQLTLDGFTVLNGSYRGKDSGDDVWTFAFGGGVLAEHASLTVRDVIFRNNQVLGGNTNQVYGGSGAGGAVAALADPANSGATVVVLERVTFDQNEAHGGDGADRGGCAHGGALFTFGVTVRGSQLKFTNNKAVGGNGRGDGRSDDGLKADSLGGAMSIQTGSIATFDHVTATGNLSRGGDAPNGDAGGAYGGAIALEKATFTLSDSEVRGNSAVGADGRNPSGDASIAGGGGLGMMGLTNTNVYLYRVRFIANLALAGNGQINGGASGGGGAMFMYSDGENVISNCEFAENWVDMGSGKWIGGGGGGLWLQGVRATVESATFSANRLSGSVQSHGAQGLALILATGVSGLGPDTTADLKSIVVANHRSIATPAGGLAAVQAAPKTTANFNGGVWANNTKNDNSGDGAAWKGTLNGLNTMIQQGAGSSRHATYLPSVVK